MFTGFFDAADRMMGQMNRQLDEQFSREVQNGMHVEETHRVYNSSNMYMTETHRVMTFGHGSGNDQPARVTSSRSGQPQQQPQRIGYERDDSRRQRRHREIQPQPQPQARDEEEYEAYMEERIRKHAFREAQQNPDIDFEQLVAERLIQCGLGHRVQEPEPQKPRPSSRASTSSRASHRSQQQQPRIEYPPSFDRQQQGSRRGLPNMDRYNQQADQRGLPY